MSNPSHRNFRKCYAVLSHCDCSSLTSDNVTQYLLLVLRTYYLDHDSTQAHDSSPYRKCELILSIHVYATAGCILVSWAGYACKQREIKASRKLQHKSNAKISVLKIFVLCDNLTCTSLCTTHAEKIVRLIFVVLGNYSNYFTTKISPSYTKTKHLWYTYAYTHMQKGLVVGNVT